MARPTTASALLFLVLAAGVLPGCMGGDDGGGDDSAGADDAEAPAPDASGSVLRLDATDVPLAPWLGALPEPYKEPAEDELIALEAHQDAAGVVRLLTDGSAFFLLVDRDLPAPALLLARIHHDNGTVTTARAAVRIEANGTVAVPLPVLRPLRMDTDYALDVYLVEPRETLALAPGDTPLADAVAALVDGAPLLPDAPFALVAEPLLTWSTPVRFHPTMELTFAGPAAGTDRPDELERPTFGGPDKGTYVVTVNGTRIWQLILDVDLAASRVAATDPETPTAGEQVFDVWLPAYRPLSEWSQAPRDEPFSRTFTLTLVVDFETGSDTPEDAPQRYHVGVVPTYRRAGQGWQTEGVGAFLDVTVKTLPAS